MTGVVNGVEVTDALLLVAGIGLELALVMIVLSRILRHAINRWANIIVGAITVVLTVLSNLQPDLDDLFFATVEIMALISIIWLAWKWTRPISQ